MPWDLTGNPDGDIGPNNFLGTRANDPLRIRTNSNVNGANAMTITPAPNAATTGDVGIGTPTPQAKLDVAGTLNVSGNVGIGGTLNVASDITLGAGRTFSAPGRLHIAGAEILYLLNTQGVIVSKAWGGNGNLTAEGSLTVNGDATFSVNLGTAGFPPTPRNPNWGGGLHTWDVEAEGTIWSMSGYAEGSDARMKANVAKLDNVLDRLDAIRGVSFERIQWGAPTARAEQRRDIGVIAQEVETAFPELVSAHGHENSKAVNYSGLTGVLIEAVKDLKAQNEALRSRIEALENGIEK